MRPARALLATILALLLLPGCAREPAEATEGWSDKELRLLRSLNLATLPPAPASTGNRHADSAAAGRLGALLFHDPGLSRNGQVACATCHQPERLFTDGRARARGLADLPRHTPTLLGAAWSPWQFWDGRADSLWAQAVQPLHDPREQGLSAGQLLQVLRTQYRQPYEQLFGPLPAQATDDHQSRLLFVNVGKALEAFQRQLRPAPSRFDHYLAGLDQPGQKPQLTRSEQAGLRLFIGRGQCVRCHLGPLLTNHGFHNTGLASRRDGMPDHGRDDGLAQLLADPLNCQGSFHDRQPPDCAHLRHIRRHAPEWLGAFKVPTLRGIRQTAPYMHDGRFATLEAVVQHYVRAPNPDGDYGHTELRPLSLDAGEQQALADFLKTL